MMVHQLNDPIMTAKSLQEFNLICITLVGFRIGAIKSDSLEGINESRIWTKHRVHLGCATLAQDTDALIRRPVDLRLVML